MCPLVRMIRSDDTDAEMRDEALTMVRREDDTDAVMRDEAQSMKRREDDQSRGECEDQESGATSRSTASWSTGRLILLLGLIMWQEILDLE